MKFVPQCSGSRENYVEVPSRRWITEGMWVDYYHVSDMQGPNPEGLALLGMKFVRALFMEAVIEQ